jgi:preprotein translocase subunit SecA
MAGRGTDIILGGAGKGLVKSIIKQLLLVQLGLVEIPEYPRDLVAPEPEPIDDSETNEDSGVDEDISFKDATSDKNKAVKPVEVEEDEDISDIPGASDPDVLALPSVYSILKHLSLSTPSRRVIRKSTEIRLKQAVISCADMISDNARQSADFSGGGKPVSPVDMRLIVEDFASKAVESSPLTDSSLRLLRQISTQTINEFDEDLKREKEIVRKIGGLYVIGTAR